MRFGSLTRIASFRVTYLSPEWLMGKRASARPRNAPQRTRDERKKPLKEVAAIAPELVSRKAAAIRTILLHAVEEIYELEEVEETANVGDETD
jgi:hypothetical protein